MRQVGQADGIAGCLGGYFKLVARIQEAQLIQESGALLWQKMKILKFRNWELLVDREATQQVYDNIDGGIADGCECSACKNFINYRESILPAEIKFLFEELGIHPSKECENCHYPIRTNGLQHYYSAWYHFKGQFKNINSSEVISTQISDNFSISFKYDATLTFFEDIENLIQVEITTEIPWTIEKELENIYK